MHVQLGRIARNTGFLYLRHFVLCVGDLYATRLVLGALGTDGFGLVAAVGGVTAMLVFLGGVLGSTAQRFLSAEIGKGDGGDLSAAFASVCGIALLLGAAIVLVGETVGLWFVNCRLSIPAEMRHAAVVVYQIGIVHMVLETLACPFLSLVNATERMGFFAWFSFVQAGLSIVAALTLCAIPSHRLEVWATMQLGLSVVVLVASAIQCRRLRPNVSWSVTLRPKAMREPGAYFGWSILHAVANILKFEGVGLLVNVYSGVASSASWRLGHIAGSYAGGIYGCFRMAVFPQVVKLWAAKDLFSFRSLVLVSTRWSFALTSLVGIPLLVATDSVLRLWLGVEPPAGAVAFVRCFAAHYLLDSIVEPLHSAALAAGRIAVYEIGQAVTIGSGFVLAAVVLALGFTSWTAVACVAFGTLLNLAWHVVYLKARLGFGLFELLRLRATPAS